MDLQSFFDSLGGQVASIAIIILLFAAILYSGKGKPADAKAMALSAVLVSLSVILDRLVLFQLPQGGSVTVFSMVPIVLCSYFLGVRRGMIAGMCVGIIDLIFNPYVIHPVQLLLDYPLAFGALAIGGVLAGQKKHAVVKCYVLGLFCRYVCAVLSGTIFFGAYAPEGFHALTWSLWYNFTYLAVEGAITVALLFIPAINRLFERLKVQIAAK